MKPSARAVFSAAHAVAGRFVDARLRARALPGFPGPIPDTLEAAYDCQDVAIALWPDEIAGWKVGRIVPPWSARFVHDRLVGPIFGRSVRIARAGESVAIPVFVGGFAAVEAEFILHLGEDAPAAKTAWSIEEAAGLVTDLYVGIEPAGSPLATINDLGPAVVVADFGNNAGLIVGPSVANWRSRRTDSLASETFIGGRSVGRGTAASVPGGPLAALAFTLARCAERGLPLRAGQLISTGATTGIHSVVAGDEARVSFGEVGEILCHAVPAQPEAGT